MINPPEELLNLLHNQREVKYLTWSMVEGKKPGNWVLEMSTVGIEKRIVGDENSLLSQLAEILFELREKEARKLKKMEKETNDNYRTIQRRRS